MAIYCIRDSHPCSHKITTFLRSSTPSKKGTEHPMGSISIEFLSRSFIQNQSHNAGLPVEVSPCGHLSDPMGEWQVDIIPGSARAFVTRSVVRSGHATLVILWILR